MRVVVTIGILLCALVFVCGVHLVLKQEEQVLAFSERTPAVVLDKRLEMIERRQTFRAGERRPRTRFTYLPVVTFSYHVQDRKFTSDNVFPSTLPIGGNLGGKSIRAVLERFEVGQETTAYYKPEDPAQACLIRRPSLLRYLAVLLPVVVGSALMPLAWRWPTEKDIRLQRRRARWITAMWYAVGVACIAHYVYVAGAHYSVVAWLLFGAYVQAGLIPLAFTLPPSHGSEFSRRVKGTIGFAFVGSFIGLWLGLLLAQFFTESAGGFLEVWVYTIAITLAVFVALALLGRAKASGEFRTMPPPESPTPEPQPASAAPASATGSGDRVPYGIDKRPMPSGQNPQALLPAEVGPFRQESLEVPHDLSRSSVYAEYRSAGEAVFVELGICDDPAGASRALRTAKSEIDAEFPDAPQQVCLNTEPSFLRTINALGAFMAWTRGGFYFSAHARGGEKHLDHFMQAFPY